MKTIGISEEVKARLNELQEELKVKLVLPKVSYDRAIKELLIHYEKGGEPEK